TLSYATTTVVVGPRSARPRASTANTLLAPRQNRLEVRSAIRNGRRVSAATRCRTGRCPGASASGLAATGDCVSSEGFQQLGVLLDHPFDRIPLDRAPPRGRTESGAAPGRGAPALQ